MSALSGMSGDFLSLLHQKDTHTQTLTEIQGNCTNPIAQDKLLFVEKQANTGPQTTFHVATQTIQRKHVSHLKYAISSLCPMMVFFTIPSVVPMHSYLTHL